MVAAAGASSTDSAAVSCCVARPSSGVVNVRAQPPRPILQPMAKMIEPTSSNSRGCVLPRASGGVLVSWNARRAASLALAPRRTAPMLCPGRTGSPAAAQRARHARATATRSGRISLSNASSSVGMPDPGGSSFSGNDQATALELALLVRRMRCCREGEPSNFLRRPGARLFPFAGEFGRAASDASAFAHRSSCSTSGATLPPGLLHKAGSSSH
mmetsp:Transcript_12825/g.37376  ORF Transcript_12825/g.37376 Transcript_12825/m.37376 type:complete len:214 (+) Transcript_12825:337-978(+)